MVFLDKPRKIVFRGRQVLTAHCTATDISELHGFAMQIGLNKRLFENKLGKQHYDLFDDMIPKAIDNGAVVIDSRQFIEVLRQYHRN